MPSWERQWQAQGHSTEPKPPLQQHPGHGRRGKPAAHLQRNSTGTWTGLKMHGGSDMATLNPDPEAALEPATQVGAGGPGLRQPWVPLQAGVPLASCPFSTQEHLLLRMKEQSLDQLAASSRETLGRQAAAAPCSLWASWRLLKAMFPIWFIIYLFFGGWYWGFSLRALHH